MPLEKCPDCRTEVSSSAPTCPRCGAKLRRSAALTLLYWVVGTIVTVFVLMFLYGLSVPEEERQANRARRLCEEMFAKGQVYSMATCQAISRR